MEPNINLIAYVDESGNSGKNLLDNKQPFFTLGSVVLNDSKLHEVKEFIDKIPDTYKDIKGEIKGNNIACYNQPLSLQILSEFIPTVAEAFFYNVLEKKFMIAGQIVDNFFDYAYNDKTDESWTYKSDMKINLANFFYDTLSNKTLKSVHLSFLAPDKDQLQKSFHEIINEIDAKEYEFDVKSILMGAEKHLESLSKSISRANAKNTITRGVPKNTLNTPNVTSFFELINRIEEYLTAIKEKAILVFDNSEQFNKIYNEMIHQMIRAPRKRVPISADVSILMGFKYLIDYRVRESNETLGLQLADMLASIVNHVFSKILVKHDDQLTEQDVLLSSVIFFLSTQLSIGYWIVSKSKSQRLARIAMKFEKYK